MSIFSKLGNWVVEKVVQKSATDAGVPKEQAKEIGKSVASSSGVVQVINKFDQDTTANAKAAAALVATVATAGVAAPTLAAAGLATVNAIKTGYKSQSILDAAVGGASIGKGLNDAATKIPKSDFVPGSAPVLIGSNENVSVTNPILAPSKNPDVGVIQAIGAGITSVINNPKTGVVLGNLIQSVTKQATASAPAAAASASASVGTSTTGITNIQTQPLAPAAQAVFGNGGVSVSGSVGKSTSSTFPTWAKWLIGIGGSIVALLLLFSLLFKRRR